MTYGIVKDMRPTIELVLRVPGQGSLAIECVIDTGFRGALALPYDAVAALNLPYVTETQAIPASGLPHRANLHEAEIVWEGQVYDVLVLATGIRPLIGTMLLSERYLGILFEEGGEVRIEPRREAQKAEPTGEE